MAYRFAYFWLDHDAPVTPGRIVQAAITMLIVTLVSNWTCQYFFRWFPFMGKHNPIFEFDPDGKPLDVLLGQWLWPHLKTKPVEDWSNYQLDTLEFDRPKKLCTKCGSRFRPHYAHPGGFDKSVIIDQELEDLEASIKAEWPDYIPVDRRIKIK